MSRRTLLGRFPDGGYGLRVSQRGYDVTGLTPNWNPSHNEYLVFNSDWASMLPVYAAGSVAVGGGASITIGYPDLGYTPFGAILVFDSSRNDTYFCTYNGSYPNTWGASDEAHAYLACQFQSNQLNLINSQVEPITVAYTVYRARAF